MSPSILFWLDLSVSFISGLVALALLFLVLGVGIRQRLNQTFGMFIVSVAITSLCSGLAGITLWLDSGTPLFWAELVAAGFYFVGPTLLAFATVHTKVTARPHKVVVLIGFLVGLALIPLLLNHQIISGVSLGETDLYDLEVTALGYTAAAGTVLFQVLTLITFWQHRRRLGSPALAISTVILVAGGLFDFLLHIPFLTLSFTYAIAILIMGYDVMSRQLFNPLRTLTEQLEAEIDQRTHELQQAGDKLQILNQRHRQAAQISREIAQITDPTAMLAHLVELIHNRLGYHHVYVYQPDAINRYLILKAAAGTTARMVLASGHRLEIGGRSLAGQVAVERRPRIAETRDDDFGNLGDTALPGARAEMAVPLIVGDRFFGVLDLQGMHLGTFLDEDLTIMTSLADQVAATLDNVRLLQETAAALVELEKTQHQYLRQAWQSAAGRPEAAPAYIYTDGIGVTTTSLSTAWSPEISQAVTEGKAVSSDGYNDQTIGDSTLRQRLDPVEGGLEVLAVPIILRGQVIGALQVRHKPGRTWQPEDTNTLSEVAERLGLALETARLSEENQRRAARERLVREITGEMGETMNVSAILQSTIQRLGQAVGAEEVSIRIMPTEPHTQAAKLERKNDEHTPVD